MKVQINCTANLGDFLNAMPVLSGMSKQENEKIHLIIRKEMRKFNGIKEFLMLQDIFEDVSFDDEIFMYQMNHINLSSWSRYDRNDPNRPIETCRYENWLKDNYAYDVNTDDNFHLVIPKLDIDYHEDMIIIGDRWSSKEDPSIDTRRKTYVIKDSGKFNNLSVHYLDYSRPLLENAAIIHYNTNKFFTTFTGIGILADLMHKPMTVLWDDDMRDWDGHPVAYDFERHYYKDRSATLEYIGDFTL